MSNDEAKMRIRQLYAELLGFWKAFESNILDHEDASITGVAKRYNDIVAELAKLIDKDFERFEARDFRGELGATMISLIYRLQYQFNYLPKLRGK